MFKKILIANRGEIAMRCLRACKELGIGSVVVHSEVDRHSLPVLYSDDAVLINELKGSKAYLNIESIISAAKSTGCEAIFPGYGYLSENSDFAKACKQNGIVFIGPHHDTIRLMGDKSEAIRMMKNSGIPTVPGSDGIVKSEKDAAKIAESIGYPVMLKASNGGGGKGLRIIHNIDEISRYFNEALVESQMYFGKNGGMYIEKFIDQGRHIEVQVLADMHGHMIHLGERECSIQRRHQKLVEECPSPSIDEHLRSRLGRMAVRAAESGGYVGAGTVEFIVDAQGNFYFVEINARIQVEHPITEMVTGVDILKELIKISAGQRLHYHQKDIEMCGHSIECRINAEDFANDFLPSPGEIKRYIQPGGPGIRVDSHIFTGYTVPHEYDSLVAKLIVHAEDRGASIARMKRALDEMYIEGIKTTIPLHKMIMDNMTFNNGLYSTGFIEELLSGKKEKSL